MVNTLLVIMVYVNNDYISPTILLSSHLVLSTVITNLLMEFDILKWSIKKL